MKKIMVILMVFLFSVTAQAVENMTYYGHFTSATNADTLITTEGLDGQNSKFIVNKVAINVFQDCNSLQYGGFKKTGSCGTYKMGAQLWQRLATTNVSTNGIAVRVYPSSTPTSDIYATPNMEYFIVGNPKSYAWQDCTNANTADYALVGSCTSGLSLWKRITPIQ
ncbi:MAG: hypothetical protein ACXWTP_04875 [Methylosarcina sp.]